MKEQTEILDTGVCDTVLYYNDAPIFILEYKDIQNVDQLLNMKVNGLSTYWINKDTEYKNEIFTFNGITPVASMSEVKDAFGVADKSGDTYLIYINRNTKENFVAFLFNDNGKLYTY